MQKYGLLSYFQLGRVYPRDETRLPYPRPKKRLVVATQTASGSVLIIVTRAASTDNIRTIAGRF